MFTALTIPDGVLGVWSAGQGILATLYSDGVVDLRGLRDGSLGYLERCPGFPRIRAIRPLAVGSEVIPRSDRSKCGSRGPRLQSHGL